MKNTLIYASVLLFLVFAASCSKKNSNSHTVKYKVGGTAKLNLTYSDQNLVLQSATNADSSWTYSFTASNVDGKVVVLSVVSQDSSNVAAHIYIDNQQANQDNGSNRISISAQIP